MPLIWLYLTEISGDTGIPSRLPRNHPPTETGAGRRNAAVKGALAHRQKLPARA